MLLATQKYQIDLIKIDVQGWEEKVLLGSKNILRKNKDISLIIEIWPRGLNEAGFNYSNILAFLFKFGFNIFVVDEHKGLCFKVNNEYKFSEMFDKYAQSGYVDIICTRNKNVISQLPIKK